VGTPTPLQPAPRSLAEFAGREDVWLKREDAHETGVFKWRGALPVVRDLAHRGHEAVVTASTGNHGAAVAWACKEVGIRAVVFVPPGSAQPKLANLERYGADVRVAGDDFDQAKDAARAYAEETELRFFEDGAEPLQYQAYEAIGDEILDQADVPAAVVTPIGNGALAGGIGAAIARREPGVTHLGVVASEMPVMAASHDAGHLVDDVRAGDTIADGLAVRVAIPLAVTRLQTTVDRVVRVSERAIAEALVVCHDADVAIEPSAAASVAALRVNGGFDEEGAVVLVMTGRNVDAALVDRARNDLESFPDREEGR
jgi:threonine dehydratase